MAEQVEENVAEPEKPVGETEVADEEAEQVKGGPRNVSFLPSIG